MIVHVLSFYRLAVALLAIAQNIIVRKILLNSNKKNPFFISLSFFFFVL